VILIACSSGSEPVNDASGKPAWLAETSSVERLMPERIRNIFNRSCASCHGLDGKGIAGVAPDLNRIPQRTAAEWVKYLRDPAGVHPASGMPPVWMTAEEITEFAAYLEVSRK